MRAITAIFSRFDDAGRAVERLRKIVADDAINVLTPSESQVDHEGLKTTADMPPVGGPMWPMKRRVFSSHLAPYGRLLEKVRGSGRAGPGLADVVEDHRGFVGIAGRPVAWAGAFGQVSTAQEICDMVVGLSGAA